MPRIVLLSILSLNIFAACGKKSSNSTVASPAAEISDEFAANCKACHGSEGQGVGSYPVLEGTTLDYDAFLSTVRDGKNDMPAFTEAKYPDAAAENDHGIFEE